MNSKKRDVRAREFASGYIDDLHRLLKSVEPSVFDRVVEEFERTRTAGSTIYLIGNGGSASIASHMANDMGVGIRCEGVKPLKIMSLADNVSTISAIGNDMGYEATFIEQLRPILNKDDILVAFSVSGNSPNIISAVNYAREQGAVVIGCTGFDGGKLKGLSDISFHIENEKGRYGPPEDAFMILDHIIYTYYCFMHYKD